MTKKCHYRNRKEEIKAKRYQRLVQSILDEIVQDDDIELVWVLQPDSWIAFRIRCLSKDRARLESNWALKPDWKAKDNREWITGEIKRHYDYAVHFRTLDTGKGPKSKRNREKVQFT